VIKKGVIAGGVTQALVVCGFVAVGGFVFREGKGCGNGDRSHFIAIKMPQGNTYYQRFVIASNLFLSGLQLRTFGLLDGLLWIVIIQKYDFFNFITKL